MPRLVRMLNGDLAIATESVWAPGYTLHVADYANDPPPHGWEYHADAVEREDFALQWAQPADAASAYSLGDIVAHVGKKWRSLIAGNVWAPGVSGWREASTDIPAWVRPTGAHDAYAADAVVQHGGDIWRSLTPANVWEPGVAQWRKIALTVPGEPVAIPAWVQPSGAGDAYALGAIVRHNGKVWKSDYAANVWEPGVFGWTEQV